MADLNNFQSINLSQYFDSVKFPSGSGYHLVNDFCIVMFYILMILIKFSLVPRTFFRMFFFRSGSGSWLGSEFHYANSFKKVILYILKIPTKFSVAPQIFCKNKNSVQDKDEAHDFTLDFNTRPTFHA